MKKIIAAFFLLFVLANNGFAQTKAIRAEGFGINFILNDFTTPRLIRTTSLSQVIRNNKAATLKDMNAGASVSYFKGLTPYIDFAATLGGSFVNMPLANRTFFQDKFLLEADASANLKMLPEDAKVNPYLIAGIGASHYSNFYGAFLPLGGGIKVNPSNEAQVYVQFQYRIPVTTDANAYHFQVTLGVSDLLRSKKQ